MNYALKDHETEVLLIMGESTGPDGKLWDWNSCMAGILTIDVDGVEHDINYDMTLDDAEQEGLVVDSGYPTTYRSKTITIETESALHLWLNEQVDEIWAQAQEEEGEEEEEEEGEEKALKVVK